MRRQGNYGLAYEPPSGIIFIFNCTDALLQGNPPTLNFDFDFDPPTWLPDQKKWLLLLG